MGEIYYYMEAANGKLARIPESRVDAWQASQERLRTNTLTDEDKRQMEAMRQAMMDDYYKTREE